MDMSIDEIICSIEGEMQIDNVAVDPGITNLGAIKGESLEDSVQNEGVVFFDVRTHVMKNQYKILLDIEAQKSSNYRSLGYHIENRMVFYLGRMISAQKNTEFFNSEYDNLKSVKSIWIYMNSMEASITRFRFLPEMIYGNIMTEIPVNQMEGIIIRVRDNADETDFTNELISMLEDLLNTQDSLQMKRHKLEKEHGIIMTQELENEVDEMCNYSELVFEKGIEQGIEQRSIGLAIKMLEQGESEDKILSFGITENELQMAKEQMCTIV